MFPSFSWLLIRGLLTKSPILAECIVVILWCCVIGCSVTLKVTKSKYKIGSRTLRPQDTSAPWDFGTTKLVPKFKTNHRWSCVSSELSGVEVSRLFLNHGTRVEVSRTTFLVSKCFEIGAEVSQSVLMPKCLVAEVSVKCPLLFYAQNLYFYFPVFVYKCFKLPLFSRWLFNFSKMKKKRLKNKTRKLCCRKDDRAMRPIWCPENVHDSLTTPTATIPNIFMGFCSDPPYECSFKIWST